MEGSWCLEDRGLESCSTSEGPAAELCPLPSPFQGWLHLFLFLRIEGLSVSEVVLGLLWGFVVLPKSQWLDFTNEDSGTRCWGESLLAQRGREYPASLLLSQCPTRNASLLLLTQKNLQTECPSFSFLCVSLSILLTSSYSMGFFPPLSLYHMFTSSQLVACPAS